MLHGCWSRFRPAVWIVLCAALDYGAPPAARHRASAYGRETPAPEELQLELPAEPFVAAAPRTPRQQRQLEAVTLFATARAAQQQEQYETALRLYQRALRFDPQSASIARAIVPLAFQLKRTAVAVRYALRAIELVEADPLLLRRLAVYLIEQGEWEQARRLYERALQSRAGGQETAADILLRMELGRLCHLIERHDEAAEHFARVLHAIDHPKDFALDDETVNVLLGAAESTYALFAEAFLMAGRFEEANAAYARANEVAPNPGAHEVNRARVFLQAGRPEEALQAVQAAFEQDLDADNAMPYRVLLDALRGLERTDEVIPRLEALREKQGDSPALRYILAEQHLERGELDRAAALYEKLLEQSPAVAAFRGLAESYRRRGRVEALLRVVGTMAEKAGMLDTIGEEAQSIAANEELLAKLIAAASEQAQEAGGALDYGRALAVALLALQGGRFDEAAEFFEAACAARPDRTADVFVTWGMGLLLNDEPGRAAGVFRRAIEENVQPKNHSVYYFYLAGALELDGRTEEALTAARKAAELDPDSPRIQERVGWVYYHAKQYDKAIDAYRRMIERFDHDHTSPETREVLRQARLVLSTLFVLQGDDAQAEPWLETLLDEFPDDPGALNDLGYLWADQNKNLDLAAEMIERAVAAQPENAAFRDSLGWVYFRMGRYQEAVAELEKAAGLEDEPDPVILDHLADAYAANGQSEKAQDAWQRAAEAFQKAGKPQKANKIKQKMGGS